MIIEALLWVAMGLCIIVAIGWLWRRTPNAVNRAGQRVVKSGPQWVQGRHDVLAPPDAGLGEAAWRLWIEGQPREALRVLYQGSLAGLATQCGLPIRPSMTEEECLRLVAAQLTDAALLDFLRRLTPIWQATAYAHRLPDAADAQRLCVEWPQHFAKAAERPA